MTPESIRAAILLGVSIPEGTYYLGDGCKLNVSDIGTRSWYRNGLLHREDGPAVEWASGAREWFRDGKHHRDDGPAIEWANAVHYWYRDGRRVEP